MELVVVVVVVIAGAWGALRATGAAGSVADVAAAPSTMVTVFCMRRAAEDKMSDVLAAPAPPLPVLE